MCSLNSKKTDLCICFQNAKSINGAFSPKSKGPIMLVFQLINLLMAVHRNMCSGELLNSLIHY